MERGLPLLRTTLSGRRQYHLGSGGKFFLIALPSLAIQAKCGSELIRRLLIRTLGGGFH
jgi:hypothetical protein